MAKKQYSFKIGLGKSFKNVLVTYVVPAVLFLLAGYAEWLPQDVVIKVAPFIAFATYLIKNYLGNR